MPAAPIVGGPPARQIGAMAETPLTHPPSLPGTGLRDGLFAGLRTAAIAVASLALGTAAVLGVLFAGIALLV